MLHVSKTVLVYNGNVMARCPEHVDAGSRRMGLGWLLPIFLLASLAAHHAHADESVTRTVRFRGGTILRLDVTDQPLTVTEIDLRGQSHTSTIRVSELDAIVLSEKSSGEDIAYVFKLIGYLGDDDYHVREAAEKKLTGMADRFDAILRQSLSAATDPEVKLRLTRIVRVSKPTGDPPGFDIFRKRGEEKYRYGIIEWPKVTCEYRNHAIELSRGAVMRIGDDAADEVASPRTRPVVVGDEAFARIHNDDDQAIDVPVKRITFETDPSGNPLTPGQDISRTFIPAGFTVSTSIRGAIVSVNNYTVEGRSKGQSCATHQPLYHGELTFRFCLPGNERVPAAVHTVGCWVAYVSPRGTALQAFDVRGNQIAEVKTTKTGHDFLAIRSRVPIASIKIVPDPQIDGDFTMDDLFFDQPRPLGEISSATDRHTLRLRGGQRLICSKATLDDNTATVTIADLGLKDVAIPRGEVVSFTVAPDRLAVPKTDEQTFWLMLDDGSIVLARRKDGFVAARAEGVTIDAKRIVALWGRKAAFGPPENDAWPKPGGAAVTYHKQNTYQLDDYAFGESWVESSGLDKEAKYTYADSPMFWFAKPPADADDGPSVRLVSGERYMLSDGGWRVAGLDDEAVTLSRGDSRAGVPLEHVISVWLAGEAGQE